MTTPNEKNLASGTIAESISASSTTILVYVGEGGATTIKGVWPTTPFYATIMPSNPNAGVANSLDSEIVLVTAVGNDQVGNTALTVTRGQRGTTTKAYAEGDIVTAGIYAEDAVLLGEDGTAENPSPWVTADDIVGSSLYDVLYENASGTNSTISLSSSVTNYPRIKIIYKSNDDFYYSKELLTSYPMDTVLDAWNPYGSSEAYCKIQKISISGSQITFGSGNQMVFYGSSNGTSNQKYIYITRVEGWKL